MQMYGWLLELQYLRLKCHLTLRLVDLTLHLGQTFFFIVRLLFWKCGYAPCCDPHQWQT